MFLFYGLPSGQFPSTFVEEITIPSTKPGDCLYVCINDFASAEPGKLCLKRGIDAVLAFMCEFANMLRCTLALHVDSLWFSHKYLMQMVPWLVCIGYRMTLHLSEGLSLLISTNIW